MERTYEQFTRRIMTTRTGKIKDIDKVARGRIFLAPEARELGMVDELGGLESAIAFAAGKASLEKGSYEVMTLPPAKTLADYLEGSKSELRFPFQPKVQISSDSVLLALPKPVRAQIAQQLRLAKLLEDRAVVLMAPFSVRVK